MRSGSSSGCMSSTSVAFLGARGDRGGRGAGARGGLDLVRSSEVDVPFEAPDRETLAQGLLVSGAASAAIEHVGIGAVREAIMDAARPFVRSDGSYRLENRFLYVITRS
jgi:hypothetical protein